MNIVDEFDELEKYKLYRNLYEVLHPSISKRNISNYKIVLEEDLVPIRVFYPEKISCIDSFIIYIHGVGEITGYSHSYSSICRELAINTKKLVLAIDYRFGGKYKFPIPLDDCYKVVKYIYQKINDYDIDSKKIVIMGDSFGGNLVASLILKAKYENDFTINKQVLISPILDNNINNTDLSGQYYTVNKLFNYYASELNNTNNPLVYPLRGNDYGNMPSTLIIVNDDDLYKDFSNKYFEKLDNNKNNKFITMGLHEYNLLNSSKIEFKNKFYNVVNDFLD